MNKITLSEILKKDQELYNSKDYFYFFLIISIPNLIFFVISIYTSISRPILNIDYCLALFFLLLPYKFVKYFGLILLIISIFFDVLMLLVQIFPFIDIASLIYLSSFLLKAPIFYIFLFLMCIFGCIFICIFTNFFVKKRKFKQPFSSFLIIIILIISYVLITLNISFSKFYGILGRGNSYVVHSQMLLYKEMTTSNFVNFMNTTPEFLPLNKDLQRASKNLENPYSPKILFVVAESWGVLKNPKAQSQVLQKIFEKKKELEYIYAGEIKASGATVEGELRELCGLELRNKGFAMSRLKKQVFQNCLPKIMSNNDYKTIAIHGTSGLLYDRNHWYVKAGFQERLFGEHLLGLQRCTAFKGVCDSELFNEIAKNFQKNASNKIFLYWMTLTSHQPYAKGDIKNKRFNCNQFKIDPNGDVCHNSQLNTQFFDNLSILIDDNNMKGVEVIVVGDHQPPVWGEKEVLQIKPFTVGYLHFKIKSY